MLIQFVQNLLVPFGFNPMPIDVIENFFLNGSITEWWQLLSPNIFVPLLFYLAFGYGMLYISFILPFRVFKYLIKAPDKKGKR